MVQHSAHGANLLLGGIIFFSKVRMVPNELFRRRLDLLVAEIV
jgi:hypothetical protein